MIYSGSSPTCHQLTVILNRQTKLERYHSFEESLVLDLKMHDIFRFILTRAEAERAAFGLKTLYDCDNAEVEYAVP